ncbi:MAG TPA: hypothetical protein VHE80_05735, partial [Acidimicrobiales bacterium]|nr:hypothetical protein [Acidimicrobiales bacterium]
VARPGAVVTVVGGGRVVVVSMAVSGGAVVVVVSMAVSGGTVAGPDGETTTTTAPPDTAIDTTTTLPPRTTVTTAPGRATTTTTRSSSGGPTTTTAMCRNSYDPACGAFRYEPALVNQPMAVEVSFSPQAPKVGQEVVFTARVRDDGPAGPGRCFNAQSYGDGTGSALCTAACVAQPARYGPWDPPPPENSSFAETFRHTYGGPGTFTAEFSYNAGHDCSLSPYRSQGGAAVQVTVTP